MKKIIASIIVIALIATTATIAIGASENTTENTTVHYVIGNSPPETPNRPQGPASGKPGNEYKYTTVTTDPDGDDVEYGWNWTGGDIEDLTVDDWTEAYPSGYTGWWITHIWGEEGTYEVRVKARDPDGSGQESDWSDPLSVTMPRNYQSSQQSTTASAFTTTTASSSQSVYSQQYTSIPSGQTQIQSAQLQSNQENQAKVTVR